MSEDRIQLSGNPFVDTGLAVIAALEGLDEVEELSVDTLREAYGDGSTLSKCNAKLKSFTQVFGTNNPLYQKAYGYKRGEGPSALNHAIYRSTLKNFLDAVDARSGPSRCQSCGAMSDFDFFKSTAKAVSDNNAKAPERKWVGRDWFPLAGSMGSDAQALPAASIPVMLCPMCLFAVHYLPLGLMLLDSKLAVFQSTSTGFWYELVREIVDEVQSRVSGGSYETLGKKEGSRSLVRRLLGLFERLISAQRLKEIPLGTALQVWKFSNSGSSPTCEIKEIPNEALEFLWKVVRAGHRTELEKLMASETRAEYDLFRCITERRDYLQLYPGRGRTGARPSLFLLYQTDVCGRAPWALSIAHVLAREASDRQKAKDLKRLQRQEAFSEVAVRSQFRRLILRLARDGTLSHVDYFALFPLREDHCGISVTFDGWDLIRYYLHHVADGDPSVNNSSLVSPPPPHTSARHRMLHHYAAVTFLDSTRLDERGSLVRKVLDRMEHHQFGVSWLKARFVQLAESQPGFTYGMWRALLASDAGELFVGEFLFLLRLFWTEWLSKGISPPTFQIEFKNQTGLPPRIESLAKQAFSRYVRERGVDRFYRDILLRLRHRVIGLDWFRSVVMIVGGNLDAPMSNDEWHDFLDEDGRFVRGERLFQLHLLVANMYREVSQEMNSMEENHGS